MTDQPGLPFGAVIETETPPPAKLPPARPTATTRAADGPPLPPCHPARLEPAATNLWRCPVDGCGRVYHWEADPAPTTNRSKRR